MAENIVERHKKQLAALRIWMLGRRYFLGLKALELIVETEKGTRKDGLTPKADHQISVTKMLVTLEPHFAYPEATLTSSLLHDLIEDHGERYTRRWVQDEFGELVGDAVWVMSKKTRGLVKTPELYFGEVAQNPIASLVKPSDRGHNLVTMLGVFSEEKQRAYVEELDTHYFPMMKKARRAFPQQAYAYENLKYMLGVQRTHLRHALKME